MSHRSGRPRRRCRARRCRGTCRSCRPILADRCRLSSVTQSEQPPPTSSLAPADLPDPRVGIADIEAARDLLGDVIRRTPVEGSRPLSRLVGGPMLAQVREPTAHRVVQASRRLRAHRAAHRRGAATRRGRCRVPATTPRVSPSRPVARRPVDGLHARRCADPEGRRDQGVRRRGAVRRHQLGSGPRRRRGVRRGDRGDLHPPVRPSRHRRGPRHDRPRDRRAVP